ncbi:MAG: hypothetical protein IIZ11_00760 [Erysipelotrichaceae bacterium]|nr:hypothetical protein [Erysipelotrichaceae bacterium]
MINNKNTILYIGLFILVLTFVGPLIGAVLKLLFWLFLIGFPVYLIYRYLTDKNKQGEKIEVNVEDFKQKEKVRVDRDGVVETEYKEREIDE